MKKAVWYFTFDKFQLCKLNGVLRIRSSDLDGVFNQFQEREVMYVPIRSACTRTVYLLHYCWKLHISPQDCRFIISISHI